MELQIHSKALAGDFDGAIASVEVARFPPFSELFEKVRIFERQGQLGLAKEIANSTLIDGASNVELNPFAAARAYVQCITDGAWVDALQEVCRMYERLLATDYRLDLNAFIVSGIGARNSN